MAAEGYIVIAAVEAALLAGLGPALIANRKGRPFLRWWLYGAAVVFVALPHALVAKPMFKEATGEAAEPRGGRRRCPSCNEELPSHAVACRYCGVSFGGRDMSSEREREHEREDGPEPRLGRGSSADFSSTAGGRPELPWSDADFARISARGNGGAPGGGSERAEAPMPDERWRDRFSPGSVGATALAAAMVIGLVLLGFQAIDPKQPVEADRQARIMVPPDAPPPAARAPASGPSAEEILPPKPLPLPGPAREESGEVAPTPLPPPKAEGPEAELLRTVMKDYIPPTPGLPREDANGSKEWPDGAVSGGNDRPAPAKSAPSAGRDTPPAAKAEETAGKKKGKKEVLAGKPLEEMSEEAAPSVPPPTSEGAVAAKAKRSPPAARPTGPRPEAGGDVTAVGELVVWLQRRLSGLGYYSGEITGRAGPETRRAIIAYQRARHLTATGRINEALIVSLRREGQRPVAYGGDR